MSIDHLQRRDIEVSLLSGLVSGPSDYMDEFMPSLASNLFTSRASRIVFEALCQLVEDQKPFDHQSLCSVLVEAGTLDSVGGSAFVFGLSAFPDRGLMESYVQNLIAARQLRHLTDMAADVTRAAMDGETAAELLPRVEAKLFEIGANAPSEQDGMESGYKEASDLIQRRINGEVICGIPSGFDFFDKLTGGFHPCLFHTIAGVPGIGKTAWAEQVAENRIFAGDPVLFVTLEMSSKQLQERIACRRAGVVLMRYLNSTCSREELLRVQKALDEVYKTKLLKIIAPVDFTGTEFRSVLRRAVRRHGIKLVILDYLQKMRAKGIVERRLQIADASSHIADGLMECKVPGLIISQINREYEKTGRPKLSHLAESAQIERDSSFAGFFWIKDQNQENPFTMAIMSVEKNRYGPSNVDQDVVWEGKFMRFRDPTLKASTPHWTDKD